MIINIMNNKGGTGKTTTCVNLSVALANFGYRVLLVDLDPQASASVSLGIEWGKLVPSISNVLFNNMSITDAIRPSGISGLYLVTGEMNLANSDITLANVPGRENRLAERLKEVQDTYDFILCDCPPSLSLLPINALVAADYFIVPLTPEYLALEGIVSLVSTIGELQAGMNIDVKLLGIIFTSVSQAFRFSRTYKLSRQIMKIVREHYGSGVFKTEIRNDIKLSEAPSHGKSIFEFDRTSRAAKEYTMLTREVLERCGMSGTKAKEAKELEASSIVSE